MTEKEITKVEEKQLVWKFKNLPTAAEVAKLVDTKVITPEEARSILFREEEKQSDEVIALKEMVKVLQEMVKDLISRKDSIQLVPYTKIVEVPYRQRPYWNEIWSTGGSDVITTTSTTSSNGGAVYTLSA